MKSGPLQMLRTRAGGLLAASGLGGSAFAVWDPDSAVRHVDVRSIRSARATARCVVDSGAVAPNA